MIFIFCRPKKHNLYKANHRLIIIKKLENKNEFSFCCDVRNF